MSKTVVNPLPFTILETFLREDVRREYKEAKGKKKREKGEIRKM
jgi:hypothetical protein